MIKYKNGKKWKIRRRLIDNGVKLRTNLSDSLRGGKPHNFVNGSLGLKRVRDIKTKEYRKWRTTIFERDNYTCQSCFGKNSGNLEADHIVPYSQSPELVLDLSNGQTLCIKCHREKTKEEMRKNWINQYSSSSSLKK